MTERPARIVTQRERVSPQVEAAVLRGLEKLPADRWTSVHEFMDALREAGDGGRAMGDGRAATDVHVRSTPRAVAVGVALLIVGVGAGWLGSRLTSRGARTDGQTVVTSILPPASGNFGEQQSLALSPDGRKLAFVLAALDGSSMLWLREMDKLESKPLPRTTGANIPFWSYDGRSLGFFANGYLQVLDTAGDIHRLCPVASPNAGSWSAEGLILFSDRRGISSVPSTGGTCRMIIPHDSGRELRGVLLPDGKRILYSRGRFSNLVVADGDGKTLGTLPVQTQMFAVVEPAYLIFSAPDELGAIDVQRMDLSALRVAGPAKRLLNNVRARGGVHTFSASREGTLAYLPGATDPPYLEYDATGLRDTIPIPGTWTVAVRPRRAGPGRRRSPSRETTSESGSTT